MEFGFNLTTLLTIRLIVPGSLHNIVDFDSAINDGFNFIEIIMCL